MGYSRSPHTLRKIEAELAPLTAGKPHAWRVADRRPDKWAYKVHEGLYIASLYPEEFPALAAVRDSYEIVIVGRDVVEARPRSTAGASSSAASVGPPAVLYCRSLTDIVDYWLKQQPSAPVCFPNAHLTPGDEEALTAFCSSRTPPWTAAVAPDGVTLSPRDQ